MLEKGKYYTDIEPVDKIPHFVEIKQCYNNSLIAALLENYKYIQGYYVTDAFNCPFDHAFNLTQNNKVLDFTAKKSDIKVNEYFGVEIPRDILLDFVELPLPVKEAFTPLQYYFIAVIDNKTHELLQRKHT